MFSLIWIALFIKESFFFTVLQGFCHKFRRLCGNLFLDSLFYSFGLVFIFEPNDIITVAL